MSAFDPERILLAGDHRHDGQAAVTGQNCPQRHPYTASGSQFWEVVMIFNIAGEDVQVDTYQTPWPLSVVWKQQGIKIQVNPQTHWWCAWLCTTTDNAKSIECTIFLESAIVPGVTAKKSCANCGDLTIRSDGTLGFRAPWEFQSVVFKGSVSFDDGAGPIDGVLVYS